MESLPQSPRGALEQNWAQLDADREARNAAEAAAAEERRKLDEQARLEHEAREARRNSDEVRVLNDKAVLEMFGSQGQTLYSHETGKTIATPEEPFMGKYDRIIDGAKNYPGPEKQKIFARAEAYKKYIQDMIDNGFEPAQANLVDQIATERYEADGKRIKAFYNHNLKTMDKAEAMAAAERQINLTHNMQGDSESWVRSLIKSKGIYTREEYDAFRASDEFKNYLNNAKAHARFNRHDNSRVEVRKDHAEKEARREVAKAAREEALREAAEKAAAEAKRKADEEAARAKVLPPPATTAARTETPRTHVNYSKNPLVRWVRGVPGSRTKDKIKYMAATLSEDVRNKRTEAREFAQTDASIAERASKYAEAGMVGASLALLHTVENADALLKTTISEEAKAQIRKQEGYRARKRREREENKGKDSYDPLDSLFGKDEGAKRGYERGDDSATPEESREQINYIRSMSVEDVAKGFDDDHVKLLSTPALNLYKQRRAAVAKIQERQRAEAPADQINLGELINAPDAATQSAVLRTLSLEQILRLSSEDVSKLQPENQRYVNILKRASAQASRVRNSNAA